MATFYYTKFTGGIFKNVDGVETTILADSSYSGPVMMADGRLAVQKYPGYWLCEADGTGLEEIPNGDDIVSGGAFSVNPAMNRMVYWSNLDGQAWLSEFNMVAGTINTFWDFNAPTAGQDLLTSDTPDSVGQQSYNPTGTGVLCKTSNNRFIIALVNGTGFEYVTTATTNNDYYASFSPDGTRIAIASESRGGTGGIFTMDLDGTDITTVYTGEAFQVNWSLDGTWLIFDNSTGIAMIKADGSGFDQLTIGGFSATGFDQVAVPPPFVYSAADIPESLKRGWQFILCNTPDPRDPSGALEELGVLESATGRTCDIVRNRAGSAGCSISVYDDYAGEILDRVSDGDVRGTLRKTLLVRRNNIDLWSGPILTIQGTLTDGGSSITLGAVGWLEYLFHREIFAETHYTTRGQDLIAYALLALARSQYPGHPVPIFAGTAFGTMADRSPTFSKGDTFGAALQRLSDVESGFDMDIDPRTRQLNLFAWDSYVTRSNIKLGYGWGPENISKLDWSENGATAVNILRASGNNNVPVVGTDTASQDDFGIWEESVNLPTEDAEILPVYVNAELAIRSNPQVVYTITPTAVGREDDGAPHLFDDFRIGDRISFTAKEGAFVVEDQGIRIFGASVSIDEEGVETVTSLQTSPAV